MVVGAGYIGVELIEAFKNHGKEVILMESMPRVMANYFDKEITDEAEKRIIDAGIEMRLITSEFAAACRSTIWESSQRVGCIA